MTNTSSRWQVLTLSLAAALHYAPVGVRADDVDAQRQSSAHASASVATPHGRPNALFIAFDDLRVELGCYGDTLARSPNPEPPSGVPPITPVTRGRRSIWPAATRTPKSSGVS